jgi:hypothetical protein
MEHPLAERRRAARHFKPEATTQQANQHPAKEGLNGRLGLDREGTD